MLQGIPTLRVKSPRSRHLWPKRLVQMAGIAEGMKESAVLRVLVWDVLSGIPMSPHTLWWEFGSCRSPRTQCSGKALPALGTAFQCSGFPSHFLTYCSVLFSGKKIKKKSRQNTSLIFKHSYRKRISLERETPSFEMSSFKDIGKNASRNLSFREYKVLPWWAQADLFTWAASEVF